MAAAETFVKALAVAGDAVNLVTALEEMGWDDARVKGTTDGDGYELHIAGTRIAVGVADDPEYAMHELVSRVADLFLLDIIEV
jgi:hypothetical protein